MAFGEVEALSVQVVGCSLTVPSQVGPEGSPIILPVDNSVACRNLCTDILDAVAERSKYIPALHGEGTICIHAAAIVQIDLVVSIGYRGNARSARESVCLSERLARR